MVVLVIIGLLASIVGPRVIGQAEEARKKKAVADFANLSTALKMYFAYLVITSHLGIIREQKMSMIWTPCS